MKKGFTLAEVLVALAVVALGISALFTALGQSSRSAEQLRGRTLANWAAADALTALRLANQAPRPGTARQEEIAGRLWWVEYRVRNSGMEALRDVEVRIAPARNVRPIASARGMVRIAQPAAPENQEEAAR
ncbi:MAG: type II secretion system minor pseudopilin GspI [Gammaproteobacteria bacterium]|nr:type II secretion system minor pseudopilin GspI [Gammaproteobacteria bacterium]MCY4340187.1 type II secretion system minor pseudopilin GspI [Gammaproteobacteria bacterium]